MTIPLKIGILDLRLELGAYALIFFGAFETAGAITAGTFKPFLNHFYYFGITVKSNLHIRPRKKSFM